jgi:hypothetical protein
MVMKVLNVACMVRMDMNGGIYGARSLLTVLQVLWREFNDIGKGFCFLTHTLTAR